MISKLVSSLTYPTRNLELRLDTPADIEAFIDSRSFECASKLEDAFVERALKLGVESGMVLDVGTRAGLIALKILWQNENFFSIGVDPSAALIDRARETATAWGLGERAFFQVGDPRRMRLKSGYFDLIVSDGVLHESADPVSLLSEIGRVLKPRGALLIRDFRRPNRFRMSREIAAQTQKLGTRMQPQVEAAMRAAFTWPEIRELTALAGIPGARAVQLGDNHLGIERQGETDPNSWVSAREQYR